MTSQIGKQIMTIHILPNISRSKKNQTMKFGKFIEVYRGCKLCSNLYKMPWSRLWSPPKNRKDLTMKLKSFPNFIFRSLFLDYSAVWRSGNEKNIITWYQDATESTIKADIFWIFTGFHGVIRVQSSIFTPTRKCHQWYR